MNKRTEILIHVAVWLVMFLSPMMFVNHGKGVTAIQFLMMSIVPLAFMLVFYLNYLWLTPYHFTSGHHRYFLVVNTVVIVSLAIGLHIWMTYVHSLYDRNNDDVNLWPAVGFFIRDVFNLTVTAAVAQNPVVQTWFTSDPAPMVSGDRMYMYVGHDEDNADFFWMYEWRVYSTSDMVNWTDHGSLLDLSSFEWADDRAWASQTIERDG